MQKFFLRIYDFFADGRRWLAFAVPLILLAGFWLGIRKIDLNEDIAAFLPYGSGESSRQSQFVYQNLRKQDKVMGLLRLRESKEDIYQTIDRLAEAADEFTYQIEEAGIEGIKDPVFRVDASSMLGVGNFIAENMPYFLDSSDYSAMDSIVKEAQWLKALEEDKATLVSTSGITQGIVSGDPFHFSSGLMKKLSALGAGSGYKVIGDYLYTPDSSAVMMSFSSEFGGSETNHNKQMLSRVYQARDSVEKLFPDVELTFTGSPVVAVMNADRMKKDSVWCAGIAVALILLLLAWYFRRIRPIILICVPVVFGIAAGLGFMGAFRAEVSGVALAACCVIFGIAVDYSLLYSTRLGFTHSPRAALSDIASPMVIGNITTVGAFLSLLVMSASGMRDFGLFAAVALVGAIVFVVLFLPHWVGKKDYKPRDGGWMGRWANLRPEESRFVFWIILVVTVVMFFFSRKVTFSGDFTKINYMAPEQRQLLADLSSYSSGKDAVAVYAVSEGETLDKALEAAEKGRSFVQASEESGSVLKSSGIGPFLPSAAAQKERLEMWKEFSQKNSAVLLKALDENSSKAGFSKDAFYSFRNLLESDLEIRGEEFFSPVTGLLSPFILKDSSSAIVMDILYCPAGKVGDLYSSYENFKEKAEGSFLFDSYSMTDKMIDILQADFNKVLAICSILVFCFLWIAFRRLELALAAFLPMVVSWIWITGIMGIFGVDFNIVNIILATFIFGLGDDYTIFMVEGLQWEHTFKKPLLPSYKTGVTLSALTMFIGVGSLVFAIHPALHSLGSVAVIGMVCVVALAFVLPPVLFRFLVCKSLRKDKQERIFPVRLADIGVTLWSGIVFAAVLLGFKLKTALGGKQSPSTLRKKIKGLMRFFSTGLPRTSFRLMLSDAEFEGKQAFKEAEKILEEEDPAVIICNHQSHLDLMYLLALSDKIAVVTNGWVYKSPVYGNFVRRAGFVCIDDGVEANLEKLKALKEEGVSILVFPEGTRSEDCSILKFKSGAFSLASELEMDILPLVIFGPGEILPKGEHILRRGKVALQFCDRIKSSQLIDWGPRQLKQAQEFRRYYTQAYSSLKGRMYADEVFKKTRDNDANLYRSEEDMV